MKKNDAAAGVGQGDKPKFASGGIVYRARGGDINSHPGKPRGTDTVPAWLTEGEFVINAKQTKKNRSLLEKINSGNLNDEAEYHADGGAVGYYQMGGGSGRRNGTPLADARREAARKRAERAKDDAMKRDANRAALQLELHQHM